MNVSQTQITRVLLIALVVTIVVGVARFCFNAKENVEAYYSGNVKSSKIESVLFGQQPTSNAAVVQSTLKAQLSVPNTRTPEPSFPILITQPSPVNLLSYEVSYLGGDNEIHTDCLRENMAKEIPGSRIISGFLANGAFSKMCAAEASMPYKPWPF